MGLYIHYPDSLVSKHTPIQGVDHPGHQLTCFSSPTPQVSYAQLCRLDAQKWGWPIQVACSVKYKSKEKLLETKTSQRNFGKKPLCLHKLVGRNLCLHRGQYYVFCFVLDRISTSSRESTRCIPPPMPRFPKKFAGLIYPLKVDPKFVQFGPSKW